MKTANITYYGSGYLSLQGRRFPNRKTVSTRLDDILPSERKRFASKLLITDPDGRIINIGAEVPAEVALEAIKRNNLVSKEVDFGVHLPAGFALLDTSLGTQVVSAGDIVSLDGAEVESGSAGALEPEPIKELTAPPPCPHDTDGDGNCGQKWCPNCNPKVAEAMKEMAEDYSMRPEVNIAAAFDAAETEAAPVAEAVPEAGVVDAVADAAAESVAEALMPKDAPKKGGKKSKQKKGESLADLL